MIVLISILEALDSLAANKLCSGLTILGIVIGVGAVIAMLGVGAGAQATITGVLTIFLGASQPSRCWWADRHHEYHAGIGHRAHARNWPWGRAGAISSSNSWPNHP
jgi:hypothetical protein